MSVRNFDALFAPRSIALIGASNRPHSVGNVVAKNLLSGGFDGAIMPVNPHAATIEGVAAFRALEALPQCPDLAVVATPAPTVPGIVADLAKMGCRAAIVISAGLGAAGSSGRTLRQEMLDHAKPKLMRIVGPNCLGLLSTPAGINASFSPVMPARGDIALVSQSGAIATAILDWAGSRGIGFSHVVSLGDMSDADFGDMLDFLSTDRATRAILLYVENVTFAKKFMSAARIAARAKPVLVIKSGRSAEGARAAQSHTGALAGSDLVYDAAFRRAGVLRVLSLESLFEAAATLATGIRIDGDRLAILTNGGGAGVLAVDWLEDLGGRLAEIGASTIEQLDAVLPPTWSHGNPVDIIGDATPERYRAALECLMQSRDADAVLVINCPTAVADNMEVGKAVIDVAKAMPRFPVLTNWLGGTTAAPVRALFAAERIASFESPEDAVRAFTHLVDYRRNQAQLMETPGAGVIIAEDDVAAARQIIAAAANDGRAWLHEWEAKEVLRLFGVPTVPTHFVPSPEAAARCFAEIGGPGVLKIVSPAITHKSDVGGVRLGIETSGQMLDAAEAMIAAVRAARPDATIAGFTVQPMVTRGDGHELIAGIARDATFGPVILFGRGGKEAEVVADRAVGLPPLNSVLARQMIAATEIAKLLRGFRNVPPVDMDRLTETLVRLSELAVLLPEVRELDINPLTANDQGVIALDARIAIDPLAERDAVAASRAVGPAIRPYPRELEHDVALRDGTAFHLRPIRPEDEDALAEMVMACAPEDLRLRFMGPMKAFPHQTAARFTQIDYDREMALIAVAPSAGYGEGPIFGVVRIVADPENEDAEFAVLVRSDMKGRGLGYVLMSAILDHARARGLVRVHGEILRENIGMRNLARDLGFHPRPSREFSDVAHVSITL
ncbi:bifunctional acetate--CoA ligase family protein/GNAT family N-acetyltransferase [Jiella sp. MQZ9-1]|uniref:Bifunctional acetate--CoA ligase family protein/GNAT family N-acetyltransferase n=1 Tax=Jiella flava TaxID=2816857 RepID=A0A939G1A8_9HYPH|nr:bifunctional acetate--CoA ligase family protein/GNAT family N-acetyltransferase [Jiella flava]MBO0664531.1 bifunctional acetate--CoA ligase family protein/GNAT family N-acetyltransferase [Jiella flava]MCD2473165.1 bifunctional acetate--CoA ligase family protein/GNAT family N-acetyltransferase [Jiella flava]